MYSVTVKDHVMIAHSLPDIFFGPAQHMHGATYVVEACFSTAQLNDKNVVIDIGYAMEVLKKVLQELAYKNLDELPQFNGILTTTEYLARYVHANIKKDIDKDIKLKVTLHESHIASASFEE